jgi:Lhr-like helicase
VARLLSARAPSRGARPSRPGTPIGQKFLAGVAALACFVVVGYLALQMAGGAEADAGPPPNYAEAVMVDPRQLVANPSAYREANIAVQGKALNVEQHRDYTWIQVMARIPGKEIGDESVVVELRPADTAILKGECYRFFGVGKGTQGVTRTLTGASDNVPLLRGYKYFSSVSDKYGGCGAP